MNKTAQKIRAGEEMGSTYFTRSRVVLYEEYGKADGTESRWQCRLPHDVHELRDLL
jgi:hypothetical protein